MPSPIFTAIPGIIAKIIYKKKLVIWVQDLWPDVVYSNTKIRNKFIYFLLKKIVRVIYGTSDLILTSSHEFVNEIKKLKNKKTVFYPNSLDVSEIDVDEISEEIKNQIDGSFNILFSGNLGRAQGIDTIIEASKRLQIIDSSIKIYLVGRR